MKAIAVVLADFAENLLGGPACLQHELAGAAVLSHTLRRVAQIDGLAARCLVVQPRDRDIAERSLRDSGVCDAFEVLAVDDGLRPRRELIRAARKWGIDAWRGTPLGTTWFDEFLDVRCVAHAMARHEAEIALTLDGHQAALDPTISSAMLAHAAAYSQETPFVFTQAPPGLTPLLLRPPTIETIAREQLTFGLSLAYRPETPRHDPVMRDVCYRVSRDVMRTRGRFIADTRHSLARLATAFDELGPGCDATTLCEHWRRADVRSPLPTETEIELTTATPHNASRLRPSNIPVREVGDLGALERRLREIAAQDDRLVFFAGHGDPLRHPEFAEIVGLARQAGVFGIGVRTTLLDPPASAIDALFDGKVDLVEVEIDAHTPQTYATLHGIDGFQRVLATMLAIQERRRAQVSARPILLPSLRRCAANFAEIEPFYNHWIQQLGGAIIKARSTFGGALAPDTLLPLAPLKRAPCRRLDTRLSLNADGTAVSCDQDYLGGQPVGSWPAESLTEIWSGKRFADLRSQHQQADWEKSAICASCAQWAAL